jgi:hypothetical protein
VTYWLEGEKGTVGITLKKDYGLMFRVGCFVLRKTDIK